MPDIYKDRRLRASSIRRVAPPRTHPRLRSLAAGLVQVARRAFSEPYLLSIERHEVALKKLAARASQLPLALEAARIQEEAVLELETGDRLGETIKKEDLK